MFYHIRTIMCYIHTIIYHICTAFLHFICLVASLHVLSLKSSVQLLLNSISPIGLCDAAEGTRVVLLLLLFCFLAQWKHWSENDPGVFVFQPAERDQPTESSVLTVVPLLNPPHFTGLLYHHQFEEIFWVFFLWMSLFWLQWRCNRDSYKDDSCYWVSITYYFGSVVFLNKCTLNFFLW